MSRSYRKTPGYVDGQNGGKKRAKRLANRKVRHYCDLPDGNAYRKVFQSYDIVDYRCLIFTRWDAAPWYYGSQSALLGKYGYRSSYFSEALDYADNRKLPCFNTLMKMQYNRKYSRK